jgi:hypothetical protein
MAERYLEAYGQIISQAAAPKPERTLSATSWLVNW